VKCADGRDGGNAVRPPLTMWFAVCWQFATAKDGVSALNLQRTLQIGSSQTAWAMLHRLRSVLTRPGRELLAGTVEGDETYVGGVWAVWNACEDFEECPQRIGMFYLDFSFLQLPMTHPGLSVKAALLTDDQRTVIFASARAPSRPLFDRIGRP
jgi:hypothetical protein